jgi:hypothetical protein
MALKMNVSVPVVTQSVVFHDAYCTACSISGSKDSMFVNVETRTGRGGEIISIRSYAFPYDLSVSDNAFRQAYTHLKTLPDFAGATEC